MSAHSGTHRIHHHAAATAEAAQKKSKSRHEKLQQRAKVTNLHEMLDALDKTTEGEERITIATMLDAVGRRSFGPLLLLAGLIALSPLTGIPSIPTIVALTVLLIVSQLLFRRQQFWLPHWLLRRSVARARMKSTLKTLRKPARFIDRLIRPRLEPLTNGVGTYFVAGACVVIACMMPMMEIIPFAAHTAGAALTAFALALISRDGLLAIAAFIFTAIAAAIVLKTFVF